MSASKLPSIDVLRQLFTYDPSSGVLSWRYRALAAKEWNTRYANKPAGAVKRKRDGRPTGISVDIKGTPFLAHRLIWGLIHGELSVELEVDHRDCNPLNNRLDNLRLANNNQQQQNARVLRKTTTGIKGVRFHRGKFQAQIKHNRVSRHLGTFNTAEQAKAAYDAAASELFGEFARA